MIQGAIARLLSHISLALLLLSVFSAMNYMFAAAQYGYMMSVGYGVYLCGKILFASLAGRVGGVQLLSITCIGAAIVSLLFAAGSS